jgi:membrane protein DedA with SNARE-associated domain
MSNGGTGQTLDQTSRATPRRRVVVLAVTFVVWAAIVVAYGIYLVRTVAEGGVESVPIGRTLIVTLVVIAIPWLHWRLTRDESAPSDDGR